MYANPTLFPQISNRESWHQTFQIWDDDTDQLISLVDADGNPLYGITVQIMAARENRGGYNGNYPSPWYDCYGEPIITATLANYVTIVDIGTIVLQIPKSIMQTLHARTYDVFMTLDDPADDDGRQLLIGKLPVFFGGRGT